MTLRRRECFWTTRSVRIMYSQQYSQDIRHAATLAIDRRLYCLVSDGQAERALALLDGRLDRRSSPLDQRRRNSLASPSGAAVTV